nr:reverse transcriptase domain-containing protein [Tanacetum cinerariifolium]
MAPKRAAPRRTTRLNPGATSDPNQAPSTTTTTITNAQLHAMINQGVNATLAARDANRTGDDSHTSGTGVRRTERVTRECTYQDFMKCQPLYFKGTEGVVELTQWFERMETVFCISNCLAENQTKFATCTLLAGALTWWNSHVRIVGSDAAYVMTWIELKKKMADKYCPRNEMKKIETELWNLEVQGTDLTRYNQRFQELALLCVRTCPEESDRVERYIGGLPDSIHGSVAASKPKTMQEATEMATGLMDKKIRTYAERQAANKRKRTERVTRECTYQDFMKCQPLYFKGTEGVVELTQWFERMETVFCISNCLAENQTKFATCTLLAGALAWWNSHVRIVGNDATYVMTWIELKKKMAKKYCPRNEMKKIETEFWNLEVQEESDRVERYIGGLPDLIHGSVTASKPKMQEATEMATGLMDKKIRTYAERQAANKRKFEDTSRNNQGRQQPLKRQNVARAYAARSGNRQQYAGSRPLCPKCNFNHDGPCTTINYDQ